MLPLPHRFPFLFVTRSGDGVEFSLSANSWWSRGGSPGRMLAIEIAAQALVARLATEAGSEGAPEGEPFLAGLDDFVWQRDLEVGRELRLRSEREVSFGRLHRFLVWLEDDRGLVASGRLLVGC